MKVTTDSYVDGHTETPCAEPSNILYSAYGNRERHRCCCHFVCVCMYVCVRGMIEVCLHLILFAVVQFVDRLLTFNHQQRITAEEALALPYVEEYYYPDDEPSALLPFGLAEDNVR